MVPRQNYSYNAKLPKRFGHQNVIFVSKEYKSERRESREVRKKTALSDLQSFRLTVFS
jgi:hypothetical protein